MKENNRTSINKLDKKVSNKKDMKEKSNLNKKKTKVIKEVSILEKKKNFDMSNLAYIYVLLKYFFENNNIKVLNELFYLQDNVLNITENLMGHILWVFDSKENKLYGSRIVELESYNGIKDKASHAYNNKKTNRNASMYKKGGISYVYICYGIHNCLNIVTNIENIPEAILIRSLEPFYNIEYFLSNKDEYISQYLLVNNLSKSKNSYKIEDNNNVEKREKEPHNLINENNYLLEIEKLSKILNMVNKKKIVKLCSGPGCVTKCLDITRKDDMKNFYVNLLNKKKKKEYFIKEEKLNVPNINQITSSNINGNLNCFDNTTILNKSGINKKENTGNNNFNISNNFSNNNNKKTNNINSNDNDNLYYMGNNIKSNFYFSSNINNLEKSRFFISICPTVNEILYFYETLNNDKNEQKCFIKNIYYNYKTYLLEYFEYMKWKKDRLIIQKDKRIGINYAEEAALYEYRFLLKNHPSVTFHPK